MSFEERIAAAVRDAAIRAYGVEIEAVHIERPNDPSHGDFATNVALANARVFRRNPREVAQGIVSALEAPFLTGAEVAGPGFVNFRVSPGALWEEVSALVADGEGYGAVEPSGEPINLEFVSANPTGPLHVAHGRHAAYGDSLARILARAGKRVSREYYFNDGGNQIRLLGESVAAAYARLHGKEWPVADPDALYRGEYVAEIARGLSEKAGTRYLEMPPEEALGEIVAFATDWCMGDIKRTLARTRVSFDAFCNEKSLYTSGAVDEVVRRLRESGHAYEEEGALWLRSSKLGDDKDRVLVKKDGSYTYMAPDLAYHLDKWERGFRTAVDVLGADHAGYPPRIRAGLAALGLPRAFLDVELIRLVKLMRAGEQVKVSKRAGTFVTLDELLDEVGPDVARYFFVRSSHKTEMNFDLELAVKQSDENPVFYVQYAHARISSIFGRAGIGPEEAGEITAAEPAAERREVHIVPTYLEELATRFHQFYTVHRVLVDDEGVRARRLALCAATKSVLAAGLELLGVDAPEKM